MQPEKWDSVTKSWRQHISLLGLVDLILIDEIHHLGDDRGCTLETIIVRMEVLNEEFKRKMSQDTGCTVSKYCRFITFCHYLTVYVSRIRARIIALSATFPNIRDVGEWLGCKPEVETLLIHIFRLNATEYCRE